MSIHEITIPARRLGLTITPADTDASLCERIVISDKYGTAVSVIYALPGVLHVLPPVISLAVSDDGGATFREVAHNITFKSAGKMLAEAFAYLVERA